MTDQTESIVITGRSVVAPEFGPDGSDAGRPTPVDPAAIIGKKGLRYKDRATQLACCAAHLALQDAGLVDEAHRAATGVVVSSNFGSADTICENLEVLAREGVAGTSPMALPNASSNVMASSIAIRNGLRGPNIMVCSGATGGADALHMARLVLSMARCDRVLVVGAEAASAAGTRMLGADLLDGAGAVVLERASAAEERGAEVLAIFGRQARGDSVASCVAALAQPAGFGQWHRGQGDAADSLPGTPEAPLPAEWGLAEGALGIIQAARAVDALRGDPSLAPVLCTSGRGSAGPVAGFVVESV